MKVLRFSDLVDVPWKNAGGTTREIATGVVEDTAAWRISRADVAQDGAFSNFAGLVRVLTVVSQNTMTLEHADGTLTAAPWKPVRFDGGIAITSHLHDGPLTDLNLMFDPQHCAGTVTTLHTPVAQTLQRPAQGILAYHVLSGTPNLGELSLSTGDTAFVETPAASLVLRNSDAVLEIRLVYHNDAIKLRIASR
ncbi:HutD family protein [Sulfitobacter sp. F26169L]|uniref:HutD/Ves family protein n=1 Tax=Sulfitobacter sp. F26169L TaxID=2996015 RepID=UPI002260ECE5|nr:HutD family protein [Sulfitobacter sp. F26169L]MCX7567397.1 HutD family protein [Sulfitobacter sp. F26169L]